MKLQFKEQEFQIQAVNAVVKCFEGQTLKTNKFTLERTNEILLKAKEAAIGLQTLDFEVEEQIGYRNSSIQITDKQIFDNIVNVQREHYLIENKNIDTVKGVNIGHNFTIEMETGTGKTYTYIRTMYELHKQYGWSKFIIIVPSIAIREGVFKTFELTQNHFQEIYGHKISPFIYNSSRPQDIETFASDNRISVMVINTQAFAAKGADARRIHQELDHFGSRRPIDIIAQTKPIIIIDEPQSVGKVGSITLKSMEDFNPLFTLRYSATHSEEYNKIFRLDALDAYNRKLVKKIQVKGINLKGSSGTTGYLYLEHISLSSNKPPLAFLEYEQRAGNGVKRVREKIAQGTDLYEVSGGLPAYKNCLVTEVNGYLNKIVVNGQDIYPGDIVNDKDELAFRRIQIRETILSHLQKEKYLFEKGIKVLSLFFIDSVEKYRKYNEMGEEEPGEYAQIFEEEYKNAINEFIDLFHQDYTDYVIETDTNKMHKSYAPGNYLEYLQRDDADLVHNGYFSIDKKGKPVDPTIKRGSEDSDDASAYDLIMKDKERLLSFKEPTRFIFSHSALKEGWDNPNVFQICALKNVDSGSQTRRRQEVGRGMRLAVDKRGVRQDFELVGDQVHDINMLTVIASESYENFAKGLQTEIAKSLKDRPVNADVKFFFGKVLTNEMGENIRLTEEDAKKLNKFLYKHDILDEDDKITAEGKEQIEKNEAPVPEYLTAFATAINQLLQTIYNGEGFKPDDDRNAVPLAVNQNFAKKEFQELWKKISLKSVYEVKFDTEKLIEDSKIRINADLHISERKYEIKTGEIHEIDKEDLKDGTAFKVTKTDPKKLSSDLYTQVAYDIVGEIEALTNLKRSTIVNILKKMNSEKFFLLRKNPEEFIAKCARLINETKASLIINNIAYHKTEESFDAKTVFTNVKNVQRSDELLKKHIYDFLETDSKIEREFTHNLEQATEVVVYAKLPKGFYIATPVANYSPDWAIVLDNEKVKHIYFVAETKGSEDANDLRGIEQLKIHCAKEHFKSISNGEVKFDVISSYSKLLDIAQLK
ncbi:MAG: DEAD/DEAH box helicase family protein [Chryseobacterium sp.]|jgi:type III restriction enzyme|uniref:type III restriction-modification system endonuclease n=1 Tax=Chryseobacterium sp. TaxID=1871047 RepID=UPI00281EA6FA|nr:DEAD/DEAH box helicase family protein [Chryseobacterium sp.]MDR2235319.1 DEAD/DEAH box helicase family protein [Chryseobacterium sp.]